MMRVEKTLPDHYREIFSVNLQRDKKTAVWINALSLLIAVPLAVAGHWMVPIHALFDFSQGMGAYALRCGALIVGMIVYMVLHELVHGITMKYFGAGKIRYGFTGLYAYAGADDYFDKSSYIIIALAPVVFWGVALAVISLFVSPGWFWVVYGIQIVNLSGAAGDLYVTAKFSRMPSDILVKDVGIGMTVYSATV